jgi:surface carbohydrate biosynthesis protein (TIGR04326 family)
MLVIWDYEESPHDDLSDVWSLKSLAETLNIRSVPRYVENNAEAIRSKYISFIYDLGQANIKGKTVIDHLNLGDGFSLWWMSHLVEKSIFKSPRIRDCINLFALEEIINSNFTKRLILYSDDDAWIEALKSLCKKLSIEFTWVSLGKSHSEFLPKTIYMLAPHILKGLISWRHMLKKWFTSRSLKNMKWFSSDGAIFICSYFIHLDRELGDRGEFYSRHWNSLPNLLQENGVRVNWLQHLLISSMLPTYSKAVNWIHKFNLEPNKYGNHAPLEKFITLRICLRVLINWTCLWIRAIYLSGAKDLFYPSNSCAWLWPFLKDEWKTSLYGTTAVSNLFWIEIFDVALHAIPYQSKGLYLYENQGWEKALIRAWRRHGHGEIIAVQHATVCFWHMFYMDDPRSMSINQVCQMPMPDYLAVNGENAKEAIMKGGYPINNIIELEALRYIDLLGARRLAKSQVDLQSMNHGLGVKNVLILGDISAKNTERLLCAINELVKSYCDAYNFSFKAHPGCGVSIENYRSLNAIEVEESLAVIVSQFDIVISANSTSAALDAYICGVSVIVWVDGNELNLSPLRGCSEVVFVTSISELRGALQNVNGSEEASDYIKNFFYLDNDLPRWRKFLNI